MSLQVYNVLTRKKETFEPQQTGKVKMYACGITASGDAHIGHALQAVVFDVIKKYLDFKGYKVTYVRNYTDVDDKIINNANAIGANPTDFANALMIKTDAELREIGVDAPTIQSKATECISDIIDFVQKLIDGKHAYAAPNGDVYFDVSSYKNYGAFSNIKQDETISGVRKEVEPGKRDDKDFALWKSAKPGEISWKSPWGNGRPGWHIECSAMSMKYLGETIDIHGGGKDLLFPHHENEIAQTESLTGKTFSKYWLHNGLIKINGQKMSKSLGNGILLQDMIKQYNQDIIRLTLLKNHYRSDVNITDDAFELFGQKVYDMYRIFDKVDKGAVGLTANTKAEIQTTVTTKFIQAMDNDFNTPVAIANLFAHFNDLQNLIAAKKYQEALDLKTAIKNVYNVLGICQMQPSLVISDMRAKYLLKNNLSEQQIEELIKKRANCKLEKDYAGADRIRNDLTEKGIELRDTGDSTEWDIILR